MPVPSVEHGLGTATSSVLLSSSGDAAASINDLENSMTQNSLLVQSNELAAEQLSTETEDNNFNANNEMADIDRRLNALQDFLKQAKSNAV